MAPEKKDKKRKAAPTATTMVIDPPTKKSKKVPASAPKQPSEALPKPILKKKNTKEQTNGSTVSPAPKANGDSTRTAKPRKRAADFLSDDDDSEAENTKTEIQKEKVTSKAAKKQLKKPADGETSVNVKKSEKQKKSPNKTAEKAVILPEKSDEASAGEDNEDEEEDLDDQTADLIRGFESSGDEDPSDDEGLDPDQPVPRIPDSKKAKRKIVKRQKKADAPEEPGTVYVGRIPHGFYEHQMRAYFSQFGDITRLRLSRNRVTGGSKHYAFVEFASMSVAKIVAETMNNYLMYGHILKCKFVPQEQQHPELWKGANRRFKRTPWNKIEKNRLERGKTREKWAKSIEQEEKRRTAKAEKLKALGYEFELPALKAVEDVPVQETPKDVEDVNGAASETIEADSNAKAIDAAEQHTDETPKKLSKKAVKEKQILSSGETANPEDAAASPTEKAKNSGKKTKKSSSKVKKVKA